MNQRGIEINNRTQIYDIKTDLTKEIYKFLNQDQKDFLDKNGGIQSYNNEPFAITFSYFDELYNKTRLFHEEKK